MCKAGNNVRPDRRSIAFVLSREIGSLSSLSTSCSCFKTAGSRSLIFPGGTLNTQGIFCVASSEDFRFIAPRASNRGNGQENVFAAHGSQ